MTTKNDGEDNWVQIKGACLNIVIMNLNMYYVLVWSEKYKGVDEM